MLRADPRCCSSNTFRMSKQLSAGGGDENRHVQASRDDKAGHARDSQLECWQLSNLRILCSTDIGQVSYAFRSGSPGTEAVRTAPRCFVLGRSTFVSSVLRQRPPISPPFFQQKRSSRANHHGLVSRRLAVNFGSWADTWKKNSNRACVLST